MSHENSDMLNAENFSQMTGLDLADSKKFIEACGNDMDKALDLFFNESSEESLSQPKTTLPQPKPITRPKINALDFDEDLDNDDENQPQSYYAGGSGKFGGGSNLCVIGNDDMRIDANKFVELAKKSGVEIVSESTEPNKKSDKPFSGPGFSLNQQQPTTSLQKNEEIIDIELYPNGILVNGTEFFDIKEKVTRSLLNNIIQGSLSAELYHVLKCKTDRPLFRINIKGSEEYVPPKPKPFSTKGYVLGSPAPKVISRDQISQGSNKKIKADSNHSTAQITYRLSNGSRSTITVNPSIHTVQDLYDHIRSETPSVQNFRLLAGYPQKIISEDSTTIDSAGLLQNLVLQHAI